MTAIEKVNAGKSARDVFGFACCEDEDYDGDVRKHFWERLGQLINSRLPGSTKAPAPEQADDEQSRKIGQTVLNYGKAHPKKKIDDIPLDYLEWAADNWSNDIGQMIRLYLDSPRIKAERRDG